MNTITRSQRVNPGTSSATHAQQRRQTANRPIGWWIAHAIVGIGGASLFLLWAWSTLSSGEGVVALSWSGRRRLVFEGAAATLFAWSMIAAAIGIFAHGFLTGFDRIRSVAALIAKGAAALFLLAMIAAVGTHLVG